MAKKKNNLFAKKQTQKATVRNMKSTKIREDSGIDLSLKNLISIIVVSSIAVYSYFGILERINVIENDNVLIKKDLEKAVEFSIKWPRGELGSLPADSEQFLLIESILTDVEDIQEELKESRHNATNITRLQKDVDRLLEEIEKIKDKVRANGNSH